MAGCASSPVSLMVLVLHSGTRRLTLDLVICFNGLYICNLGFCPKLRTFSVFLPSLSNSSAVCANPNADHDNSTAARTFFTCNSPFEKPLAMKERCGIRRSITNVTICF